MATDLAVLKEENEGIKGIYMPVVGGYSFEPCNFPGRVSDGYHSFDELYYHRCLLFCAFLKHHDSWKSRLHSDGSSWPGWFVAGADLKGKQITYHLPNEMWKLCPAMTVDRAPEWDGHDSSQVCDRIEEWLRSGGYG